MSRAKEIINVLSEGTKITKDFKQIVFDLDAGGGSTLDLYYNKKESFFLELKTLPSGKVVERIIPEDEIDPKNFGMSVSQFNKVT